MTDQNTIREDTNGILDFVGEVSKQLRSRRSFMGDAAKVGAGAAAFGAVGTGTVAANDGNSGNNNGNSGNNNGENELSDLDILNYALTLEHLEATYYRQFLDEYDENDVERSEIAKYFARPTLRYSLYQQIEDVHSHEEQHVDKLTETIKSLGGTPVQQAEYEFPYDSLEGFVMLADRLEAIGVSAYAGAAPLISNPDLIPPALSIHSVEANHWTFFNFLALRRAAPNAFNPARTMDQVLPIAKKFIVGPGGGGGEEPGQTVTIDLSGEEEVPPVDTDATGQATLTLKRNPPRLEYKVTVSNIENAIAAHIHLGNAGENGPIVAPLFSDKSGVSKDGVLATGTITESDLVGPLKGKSASELRSMVNRGAYVNVHTKEHPAGEIRGQVRV